MKPFTPPTDNLYKFIAIAGLLLMFFSLFGPTLYVISAKTKLADLKAEIRKLKLEIEYLKEDAQRLSGKPIDQMDDSEFSIEQIAKRREIELREVRVDEIVTLEEWKSTTMTAALILLSVTAISGSFMTIKGFTLWYDRLQVFQDIKIKNEAMGDAKRLGAAPSQETEESDRRLLSETSAAEGAIEESMEQ